MHGAKEVDRDGYGERVRERERKREWDGEWERKIERKRYTKFEGGSINEPSIRGRVGLTLKLDELLWPSMTIEVIHIQIKYLHIHNISIHINFYQNKWMC